MKRALLGALAATVVLSASATAAFAAYPMGQHHTANTDSVVCAPSGHACADTNGDGVCDVCGISYMGDTAKMYCGGNFIDADGDGLCDTCGIAHGTGAVGTHCGRNFIDENGDGICDTYASGRGQHGHGGRHGHGGHR